MNFTVEQIKATAKERNIHIPDDFDIDAECSHLNLLIKQHLAKYIDAYSEEQFEGAGGSGIVFSAIFNPFGTRRAFKVPRKRIFENPSEEIPEIDPELHALSKVSHQNVTRLFDSINLGKPGLSCMVTEYVEGARPLDDYAFTTCCTDQCRRSDLKRAQAMRSLSNVIYKIVDAMCYMHDTAKLLHFDLKPDNLLIDVNGTPFVTDLGFARDLTRYNPDDLVEFGFTWKYAHPDIRNPDEGARVTRTPAKSKNKKKASELNAIYDVFAFGRSLQETLKQIENVYGENAESDYTYNYLHLIGAFCLNGKNAANGHLNPESSFVTDQALGLPTDFYKKHYFKTFSEIKVALERLLGFRRVEDEVPELDTFSSSTINVSHLGITTFTTRVRSLVEHPAMQRLRGEYQLGMLDTVFPTATHTRLQHSLGVYHCATLYTTSLYYDPENPLFRVLFSPDKCRVILIAALLHDIGQTTFGHEMEEVDKELFSHVKIGQALLESNDVKDLRGRSLKDIITEKEPIGWSISVEQVLNAISGKSLLPIDYLWHDILDGHLDADKLDYLTRDSVECRVQYGNGIDHDRLVRSLTTRAIEGDDKRPQIRLAVKKKGAASAEAFAFARYQLYQALYWHHTVRAVKAMFLTAASQISETVRKEEVKADFITANAFAAAYVQDVVGIPAADVFGPFEIAAPTTTKKKKKVGYVEARLKERSGIVGNHPSDRILSFLWKLADYRERNLLEDLASRKFYKRLIEIPVGSLGDDDLFKLRGQFEGEKRRIVENKVEEALINLLRSEIQGQMETRESLVIDDTLEKFDRIVRERRVFVIDLPLMGWSSGGNPPIFVSDFKRRHFRGNSMGGELGEEARLWRDIVGKLMRGIAAFRVFAEPDAHRIATRVLKIEKIMSAVYDAVPLLRKN